MSDLSKTKSALLELTAMVNDSLFLIENEFEYTAECIVDLIEVKAMFTNLKDKLDNTYTKIKENEQHTD